MTDTSAPAPKASLGVGAIVGETFSIFFRKIGPILLLAFIPSFLVLVISGALFGWSVALGQPEVGIDPNSFFIGTIVNTILNLVVSALITGLLVLLAYDVKLGRDIKLSRYFGPALKAVVPIALLSLAIGILAGVAAIALIIPALWVYAVFFVTTPAILIENAGFGGMGRSVNLTKEYRWPIVGVFLLIGIISAVLSFVAAFLTGTLMSASGGGVFIGIALMALISAVMYGLVGICVALTYARLREIKEGVGVDDIAAVFD